ncbi:MAG: hypothetical protein GY849_12815 [Deltaproteobacteria bacterium]|nr:hypothetical protein [Deltaproteobacteria bacterium]
MKTTVSPNQNTNSPQPYRTWQDLPGEGEEGKKKRFYASEGSKAETKTHGYAGASLRIPPDLKELLRQKKDLEQKLHSPLRALGITGPDDERFRRMFPFYMETEERRAEKQEQLLRDEALREKLRQELKDRRRLEQEDLIRAGRLEQKRFERRIDDMAQRLRLARNKARIRKLLTQRRKNVRAEQVYTQGLSVRQQLLKEKRIKEAIQEEAHARRSALKRQEELENKPQGKPERRLEEKWPGQWLEREYEQKAEEQRQAALETLRARKKEEECLDEGPDAMLRRKARIRQDRAGEELLNTRRRAEQEVRQAEIFEERRRVELQQQAEEEQLRERAKKKAIQLKREAFEQEKIAEEIRQRALERKREERELEERLDKRRASM